MNWQELYYLDPFQMDFTGVLVDKVIYQGQTALVLDRTCFYPEGGGQPGDRGILRLEGPEPVDLAVKDTRFLDGRIIHFVEGGCSLELGARFKGEVDRDRRLDMMQQHTGEHIISGLVHQRYGYNNVGFNIGEEFTSFDFDGELTEEEVADLELACNRVVAANLPVEIRLYNQTELADVDYRSKLDLQGTVRLVTVPGVDTCACCGTHVTTTGQIAYIKIISREKYKSGVRLQVVCGQRAVKFMQEAYKQLQTASRLFSSSSDKLTQNILALQEKQKQAAIELKTKNQQLIENHLAELEVGNGQKLAYDIWETDYFKSRELKLPALAAAEEVEYFALVLLAVEPRGYRFALASTKLDLLALKPLISQELKIKAGGSKSLLEGVVDNTLEEIVDLLPGLICTYNPEA